MILAIRTTTPGDLEDNIICDFTHVINSQDEWRGHIESVGSRLISSVVYPERIVKPTFRFDGPNLYTKGHAHERFFQLTDEIASTYREGAKKLAASIETHYQDAKNILVYLPLRGARPIWQAITPYLSPELKKRMTAYYPVTSSFVMYPEHLGIKGKHGGNASGRYTNILELKRIMSRYLQPFDHFLYVDEIISGGMMWGHVKEMLEMGLHEQIPITVAGLADAFGTRFGEGKKGKLTSLAKDKKISLFYEGCHTLISEDQKFLCGESYTNHKFGPNVVPVMTEELDWFPEKHAFKEKVLTVQG